MTVQAMHREGGRRFGPTALAQRPVPAARRLGGAGRVSPPRAGQPCPAVLPVPARGAVRAGGRVAPVRSSRRRRGLAPCPTGSAGGRYPMGRWARLSMTVVVTAAIIVAMLTVVMHPATAPTAFVTVGPGDTLASIVARDLPGWDPSRAMDTVASLNGLQDRAVGVGTVLRIPASG